MEAVLFVIESMTFQFDILGEKETDFSGNWTKLIHSYVYYSICYFLENYSYFFSVRQFIYFLIC